VSPAIFALQCSCTRGSWRRSTAAAAGRQQGESCGLRKGVVRLRLMCSLCIQFDKHTGVGRVNAAAAAAGRNGSKAATASPVRYRALVSIRLLTSYSGSTDSNHCEQTSQQLSSHLKYTDLSH
jgi:hypothetical protein